MERLKTVKNQKILTSLKTVRNQRKNDIYQLYRALTPSLDGISYSEFRDFFSILESLGVGDISGFQSRSFQWTILKDEFITGNIIPINYIPEFSFPISNQKIAIVKLPKNFTKQDIELIQRHLELVKETVASLISVW